MYLREQCPNCGTFDADWRDPATKRELDEPRWMPAAHRCIGCARLAEEKDEIPDSEKGIYVGLVPWVDPDVVDLQAELDAERALLHPIDDDDE